jgi:diguanylate cyclase (GGDEF)-like protein
VVGVAPEAEEIPMPSYPVPANEDERLEILHSLGMDFSAPVEEIQRLTELASQIAKTPIALVSLVDADVQSFAANVGLQGLSGTSRDVAFCAHAIMERNQLVVADARKDRRFRDNPLVTGGIGIRAYAGSVLEPEPGAHVGTLCVIDTTPRTFDADVLRQLDHLSFGISALLRAHRDRLHLRDRLAAEARQQVALRDLAIRDPLTGLLNQSGFRARVDRRLTQGHAEDSLAVIDIDHFKQVNDRWGHPFGDSYLTLIAEGLVAGLGPDAIVGRIGGDEFAALLPSSGPDAALAAIRAARLRIQEAMAGLGKANLGRLSIGLSAMADAPERTFEALYQRADVALYASKDRGRNTTSVFSHDLNSRYNLRVLRARFSEALEAGEVEAFFQPCSTFGPAGSWALSCWPAGATGGAAFCCPPTSSPCSRIRSSRPT